MSNEQVKISGVDAALVYGEVPNTLRKLASERDQLLETNSELRAKVASYETEERIQKIAASMRAKGLNHGLSFVEQIERVKEAQANGKSLDAIEAAVDMTAPNGEIAKLGNDQSRSGRSAFESFILGDE